MATLAGDQGADAATILFTCLSCSIAFPSADDQREHYRSDHHRYNMKRRVAGLPPLNAEIFNQKVLERRAETAIMASPKGSYCEVCGKTYTTENAYRSHINSKKHKETEARAMKKPRMVEDHADLPAIPAISHTSLSPGDNSPDIAMTETIHAVPSPISLAVDEDASEAEVNQTIDEKIAAARSLLQPTQCLFCTEGSASLEINLTHMSTAHSFFIPDAEFLTDITGLITYLGEKIAVGNVCIYCNGKGREFRTLDAVRKHMVDKAHCKIAYDKENDKMEISNFYDFSSSYPVGKSSNAKSSSRSKTSEENEWEDLADGDENDVDVDEVVDEVSDDGSDSDEVEDNQITYGDTVYELVLPSGARIGHRSMRRYYAQSFRAPLAGKDDDPTSGAGLVRKLLADKNSALVPRRGGFGAFGSGTDIVKARNRGEAREAGRHVREFRDQKRREDYKTRVGFVHNNQKHFRDHLLQ